MKRAFQYIFASILMLSLVACEPDVQPELSQVYVVQETIEPMHTSVYISCKFTSQMSPIESAEAILSLSPTNTDSIIIVELEKKGEDVFGGATDGLTPDTTYYVLYKVANSLSSILSEYEGSFKTFALGMPVVYTDSVINITYTSAMVCTTIKDDGGSTITQAGFCYSTSPMPTVEDDKVVNTDTTKGAYLSYLNDLTHGTKYYVRAFATNANGSTSYGRELCFTTEEHTYHMDHEYIDLGLSVYWAIENLGDSLPAKSGDYYAWGETKTKTDYSWSTYQYGSSSSLTKYNDVDNKTQLDSLDDAAHVNWGGEWRMPTSKELAELYQNCDWTYIADQQGFRVTSRINGKSIFLPMGGCMSGTSIFEPGKHAYYWTNTLSDDPSLVHVLYFNNKGYKDVTSPRCYGCFIRPVYPK
jgi:hypothetical protein